jgi:fumarate reductase (CoM/CoB) subunit A
MLELENSTNLTTDVLVIGTGCAGLAAALEAARCGVRVLLVDKGLAGKSGCSVSAEQIAACVPGLVPGDGPEVHFKDTISSGQRLNDPRLVRVLAEQSFSAISNLEGIGVVFDRDSAGRYAVDPMNGHSFPRSLFHSDITGKIIVDALMAETRRLGVTRAEDLLITEVVKAGEEAVGAVGLDHKQGSIAVISARSVIIASGGAGQLFPLTTNPAQATGDGLSLALKAGAIARDLEFYQFYPVTVIHPQTLRGFVLGISQFGKLFNRKGERFMDKYAPREMEAATRDLLSQGMFSEIRCGNGSERGGLFLDVSGLEESVYEAYADALRITLRHGIDLRRERIEVAPAAHYAMGGIKITERGETNVPGLYAAGEVAGGIHGANRLGNNSLLDTVVFGSRAGRAAGEFALGIDRLQRNPDQVQAERARLQGLVKRGKKSRRPHDIRQQLWAVMDRQVGIIRNQTGLGGAEREFFQLEHLLKEETGVSPGHFRHNLQLVDFLELENMLLYAQAMVKCALLREESRGAHFREDFSRLDDKGLVSAEVVLKDSGVSVSRVPCFPVAVEDDHR